MSGVSTEDAVHPIVAGLDGALKTGKHALCAFLEFKGAFIDATFKSLREGLLRNDNNTACRRWIFGMLVNRSAEAILAGKSRHRTVESGCPQDGVLSPLLWNLVAEEVLSRLKTAIPQVYCQDFADELGLVT